MYLLKTTFAAKIKLNLVLSRQLEEKQKQKRNRVYALCLFHNSFCEELKTGHSFCILVCLFWQMSSKCQSILSSLDQAFTLHS